MVEALQIQYPLSRSLLRLTSYFLAGGEIAQLFSCIAFYLLVNDSQVAGMIAHLLIQALSYYFMGCTFVILSLSNILVKRGLSTLKEVRTPSLILLLIIAATSILIIPRMDYLRETALLDGKPVMLSHFAEYFEILNGLTLLLLVIQITYGVLIAWRLSDIQSTQVGSN